MAVHEGFSLPAERAVEVGSDSRAAWLVLLTQADGVRALLFNAARHYLTEVIDDPLTVERLCDTGRRCLPPAGLLLDAALPHAGAVDIRCFALGRH